MSSWVLSSNPTTTYLAEESLEVNSEMDWISKNRFKVGDTVFIYEVLPPSGRGGIIYRTEVTATGLTTDNKIVDKEFWVGMDYPKYITDNTRFNRLKRRGRPHGGIIPFDNLKMEGFVAPQSKAHLLDKKPRLLKYIEGYFD